MVKLKETQAGIDAGHGLDAVLARLPSSEAETVRRADDHARAAYEGRTHPSGEPWLDHARGAARVAAGLGVGGEAISSMLLLGAGPGDAKAREAFRSAFGPAILSLVEGVASMAQIQALRARSASVKSEDRSAQLEALRKMFLAM